MKPKISTFRRFIFYWAVIIFLSFFLPYTAFSAPHEISVLMFSDIREEPFRGFQSGMENLGFKEGKDVAYEIFNAKGDRGALPGLAEKIVESNPVVAIACGGLEADALNAASKGTSVPTVFLAVSSAVDRGLAASMPNPGGNLTGIDTGDTQLTAKRLWYIKKLFPEAKRVIIPHVTTVPPSVKSVAVATAAAPELGLEVHIMEAANKDELREKVSRITQADGDVILIVPSAPLWQIEKAVVYPVSKATGIPIMGVNRKDLTKGAVACYGGTRFDAGVQAARLVEKVLAGEKPGDIPVETPSNLAFVINRKTLQLLGLKPPRRAWRLADDVVDIEVR